MTVRALIEYLRTVDPELPCVVMDFDEENDVDTYPPVNPALGTAVDEEGNEFEALVF